jgi:hypothetical protein
MPEMINSALQQIHPEAAYFTTTKAAVSHRTSCHRAG